MDNIPSIAIKKMIHYFGNDIRRINHAIKVYGFSKAIGESENLNKKDMLILELAAILHDIGIKESEKKYNSSAGNYQEIEGPPIARKLLRDVPINEEILSRICYLIGNHHSYDKINGMDLNILVESDFLVNAYEDKLNFSEIKIMKEKYFKTKTGIDYLNCMYKKR